VPVDTVAAAPRTEMSSATSRRSSMLFLTACWFALLAGLVEGAGLLLFQRINWAQWARVLHVSKEILWISPVVDFIFFSLIACGVALVARVLPRIPALRVLVFILTLLTAYDWLLVTGRLYKRACLLLALGVAVAFVRWLRKHEASAVRFWKRSTVVLLGIFLILVISIEGGKRLHLVALGELLRRRLGNRRQRPFHALERHRRRSSIVADRNHVAGNHLFGGDQT